MGTINLNRGRATKFPSNRIITPEEYNALMSELTPGTLPKYLPPISNFDEKMKKLDFNLVILVGLILVVITLCQHS